MIYSERDYREYGSKWPIHERELKEKLGLPIRLEPTTRGVFGIQGYTVIVMDAVSARLLRPNSSKPHRVRVCCKGCGCYIAAGRLQQHEPACKQLNDNTTI